MRIFGVLLVLITSAAAEADVKPFFEEHCVRCHGPDRQKGDFRIDTLPRDFGDLLVAQEWDEVMLRINAGEMPPEDEKQPDVNVVGDVAEWISARLEEGRAARMSKRTPVTMYRLSREEYAYTVYDLLGVQFDVEAPGALNEDPRWHGFDRIGSLLTLSPSHVDRYFEAAQKIVADAFPPAEAAVTTGRVEAGADARSKQWLEDHPEITRPIRMLILPGQRSNGTIYARHAGTYRIRIQLSALPSFRGKLPHLSVWDDQSKRSLHDVDVHAPEDEPAVIEFETYLPEGRFHLKNEGAGVFEARALSHTKESPFLHSTERRFIHPGSYKLFDNNGEAVVPLLVVDSFEWEGPIVADADRKKREGVIPATEDSADVRKSLTAFLSRAWRRPVHSTEVDGFIALIEAEQAAGEKFRDAYLSALAAALTSKNFYYHHEGTADENRARVNDFELAARLSSFLWSSMPDEALSAAALSESLTRPEILRGQLTRMLADPKIARFLDSFPRQWLQLHKVGAFPPDIELYPDYDAWLEKSMTLESTGYFAEVFSSNLSVREFLDSDWTMVNPRLALHYGLTQPETPNLARVPLQPDDRRGGILTHASVLSLTSDGTRHRPVHRGVWVSEAIFGKTPPPPPPNVEPLEPTPSDEPKATIRMQLEAHATHASCASCHRKIDPLGFAFDNYDAIGRWRTHEELATGEGDHPPVDASGVFADGRAFSGPAEFQQLLAGDLDRFAEAFTGQLATYALRRPMTIDDSKEIAAIAESCRASDYRLRDLIEAFVMSELFQRR